MLTVGIVASCQADYTQYCLESVLAERLVQQHNAPVIVVINDAPYSVVHAVEQLQTAYPNVSTILNTKNHGYALACNQILEQTQTEYVAFLHNDVIVPHNVFELLIEGLQDCNDIICAFPKTSYAAEAIFVNQTIAQSFLRLKPQNKKKILHRELQYLIEQLYGNLTTFAEQQKEQCELEREIVLEISSYCCLYDTEKLRQVGGFDSAYKFRGYEDKALHDQIREALYRIVLCHNAFVHHHGNLSTDGIGYSLPEILEHNRKIYQGER